MKKTKNNIAPKEITDIWVDFQWDTKKMWELDLPVEVMEIATLEWHLDFPLWEKGTQFYKLSPNEVLKNPGRYVSHFLNVLSADLRFPIDIIWWRKRWIILDGVHRLAKQKYFNYRKVYVRKIPHQAIPLIKK